jgi:hypothetical protein
MFTEMFTESPERGLRVTIDDDKRMVCEKVYGGRWIEQTYGEGTPRHVCTITQENPNISWSIHAAFVDEENDPIVQTITLLRNEGGEPPPIVIDPGTVPYPTREDWEAVKRYFATKHGLDNHDDGDNAGNSIP